MASVTGGTSPPPQTSEHLNSPALVPALSFLGRFLVLRGAVRELWLSLAIKMLAIFAYTVMNQTLSLWLTSDLGYNDRDTGYLVMGWSSVMTLFTVLVGSFTDAIGLRKTLLIGSSV